MPITTAAKELQATYCCLEADDPQVAKICNRHAQLFEQTFSWLDATKDHVLNPSESIHYHALMAEGKVLILWPLIHRKQGRRSQISSAASCYTTNSLPYFCTQSNNAALVKMLIVEVCTRYPWDELLIGPHDSHRVEEALTSISHFHKDYAIVGHWYIDQLSDYADYALARPGRLKSTLKRKTKKLHDDYNIAIKYVTTPETFIDIFTDYQIIYQKSWKGDEASFSFIEQVCLAALAENKLRFAMMYANDKPVAGQIWFLQREIASIFKLAYDPEFSHYSVGSILTAKLCERIIDDDKCHTIEFGCGHERYKQDWMSKNHHRKVIQLFNMQTFDGKLLIIKHIYLSGVKRILKKLIRRK